MKHISFFIYKVHLYWTFLHPKWVISVVVCFVLAGKDFEDTSGQIHPSLCLLLVVPHHTVGGIHYHGDVS